MSQQVKITARELIRRSLILIGALGQGENPTDQEADDALKTLNEIVDKWNVEALMITSNKYIKFNLTNKKIYTIGAGGDIPELRPPSGLLGAYYNMPNTSGGVISVPVQVITENQYNSITLKDLQVNIPSQVFYRNSYPLAEIYVYPISNEGELVLNVSNQFLAFNNLDDIIDLPSGYVKALRYNLAVELSTEYGRQLSEKIEAMAVGAKSFIKTTNGAQKQRISVVDTALRSRGGGYNIYTGE